MMIWIVIGAFMLGGTIGSVGTAIIVANNYAEMRAQANRDR